MGVPDRDSVYREENILIKVLSFLNQEVAKTGIRKEGAQMSEIQNVVTMFDVFVRRVVGRQESIKSLYAQVARLSELYRQELSDHPWELLTALRETEERLKVDLGDRYYISFAENIVNVSEVENSLGYTIEGVEHLKDLFNTKRARLPSAEETLYSYLSERVLRPRHFVYYLDEQRHSVLRNSGLGTGQFSDPTSDALATLGAAATHQTLASWMIPDIVSNEEQVDSQFLAYVEANEKMEEQLGLELGKLGAIAQEAASQVEQLNTSISELSSYFGEASDWAAKFERQLESSSAREVQ